MNRQQLNDEATLLLHNVKALTELLNSDFPLTDDQILELSTLVNSRAIEINKIIRRQPVIPIERCFHGGLYKVSARNFNLAVFNENSKGFIGIREKFGREYLDTEYHCETTGSCFPKEFIEYAPNTLEIKESEEGDYDQALQCTTWRTYKPLFDYLQEAKKRMTQV